VPGPDAHAVVDLALRLSDLKNLNRVQYFAHRLDNNPPQRHTVLSIALVCGNWALATRLIDLGATIPADTTLRAHSYGEASLIFNLSAVAPGAQPPPASSLDTLNDGLRRGQFVPLGLVTWLSLFCFLINAGVDVNERVHPDYQKDTLLQACIRRRVDVSVIEALLQAGANPFLKWEDEFDCFQLALLYRPDIHHCSNTAAVIQCLWTWAQKMRPPGSSLWSHEEEAATDPSLSEEDRCLELLRGRGAINIPGRFGGTLLVHASRRGNMWLAKRLIAYGADVRAVDRYGWSALHSAAYYQDLEMITLLLEAGADIAQRGDQDGSAMGLWVCSGCATPLQVFIESLAINWPRYHGGETNDAEAIVRTLLRSGSDPNDMVVASQRCRSWAKGKTPLTMLFAALPEASVPEHIDQLVSIIRVLCDSGADVAAAARNMTIAAVAKLERHASLWDFIRSQLLEERNGGEF